MLKKKTKNRTSGCQLVARIDFSILIMNDQSKLNFRKSKKNNFLRADLIDYWNIDWKSSSLLNDKTHIKVKWNLTVI